MKLRRIDFGHVFNASGARNFTGRGWPFHFLLKILGLLRYLGSTFVSKTTTLTFRLGNMKLREDGLTPKDRFPDCIIIKWFKGAVLNAVNLSGRGALWLLDHADLAKFTEPFVLSFATVGESKRDRLIEMRRFINLVQEKRTRFRALFALQINISCPNTGHNWLEVAGEAREMLDIASVLDVPLEIKISVQMSIKIAAEIASHPACDAVVISNSVFFGALPERINWKKLFGSDISPLKKYGGGGLSGKPLLPLVLEWITSATLQKFPKPIIGCGGILSKKDAKAMFKAGADAIEIGSASILRFWRVRGIIKYVNKHFAHVGA